MFSWRGFLYYKWSMGKFWPDVVSVLREINKVQPLGAVTPTQLGDLAAQRRTIIEMVRDNGNHVNRVLAVYDTSFRDLVEKQTPRTFRDFLMSAPHLFLELGEKLGAISHIVSFWRYRFPKGRPVNIDCRRTVGDLPRFLQRLWRADPGRRPADQAPQGHRHHRRLTGVLPTKAETCRVRVPHGTARQCLELLVRAARSKAVI